MSDLTRSVVIFLDKTRYEIVNQLGYGSVLANDNKAGRNMNAAFLPQFECLFVMTIECFKGGLQFDRQAERVKGF